MPVFKPTFGDIQDNVIAKLRLDPDEDATLVKQWINHAYLDVCQQTQCLQQAADGTLIADETSYYMPVDVAAILKLTILFENGTISRPLRRVPLATILAYRSQFGFQTDYPVYAVVGQTQIELWPTPVGGETITFWYSYLPESLVADDDESVIQEPYGSKLLEYGALVEGARFKKDPLLSDFEVQNQFWFGRFQTWLNRLPGTLGQFAFATPFEWDILEAESER